jgi:hypothetical protein
MALNVKINFEERYELETSNNTTSGRFTSRLKDGKEVQLGIEIGAEAHPLMPDVHNLAFGPLDDVGQIDDRIRLSHVDHSRVFSTILFASLLFLKEYPGRYLGVDGSNNARAYMYYRCIRNNLAYLSEQFNIRGVKYYIRILRKLCDADDGFPIDGDDLIVVPKLIAADERIQSDKLYNYFIFNLK